MGKRFTLVVSMFVLLIVATACNSGKDETVETEALEDYNRIRIASVTASSDDGNLPSNTIDNFNDTRWSADGDGEFIVYDLGELQTLAYAAIAFHNGDIRYTDFDLAVSLDGEEWTDVYSGNNKEAATLDLVKFDIEDVKARYVRLTGHGYVYLDESKTGSWNSITEVQFYSDDALALDTLSMSELPVEVTYTEAGLMNPDGSVHEIHTPNKVTGKTIEVDEFTGQAIQKAIDGASEGDEVFLPAGSYEVSSQVYLRSKVNLRGEKGTIVKAVAGPNGYEDNVLVLSGINNLVLSDMTITSAFDGSFTTNHSTNNPEADGPKYVVRVTDNGSHVPSYNITIDGLTIEKYQTMGVRIANAHDVVVQNSVFENATDIGGGGAGYGVSIQGEGNNLNRLGYKNDTRYNVVRDCQFNGPYLRHGVLIQYYAHNNLVTNNVLTTTKLDAIDLHGEDEYLNEISHNTISNIETGAGIGVGNTGASHDKSGPGNWIHDNTITNAREGIKVHLGSADTLIENNLITGTQVVNGMGIYLQNAPGTIIRKNTISESEAINFWGIVINADSGYEGREAGVARDVTIEDNVFKNIPGGMKITAAENLQSQGNLYDNIEAIHIYDTRSYDYEAELIPSQVLSLTNWKINLPIEGAKEIRQPDLKTFEDERFFFVNEDQDGIVFKAPCQADETDATTANSKYPRSELREMAYGGMAEANWDTDNGTHTMIIDQMITHTPEVKPHVVVGQIHDADDDVVMIRLEGERLFVEAEGVDLGALDTEYKLGTRFQVMIIAREDVIDVKYNGETMVSYPVHKEGCYFKAGMYTQSNVDKGDGPDAYGEVVIYDLKVSHADVEQEAVQTYDNSPIPSSEASAILPTTLDTYIDLMKVDGLITANVSPRNTDEMLMVKTSSGQTTIRLAFMEFDLSDLSERPTAASLKVVGKDINGSSDLKIYGFEKSFGQALVWGDLYTADSRISKNNSEVMDYLNHFGRLTGQATIDPKDPSKPVEDKDHYSINVSDFISHTDASVVTLVLVEEIGVNVNLQLHSTESDPQLAPSLSVWTGDEAVERPVEVATVEADLKEDKTDEVEGTVADAGINLDVVDVDDALRELNYDLLSNQGMKVYLPRSLGKGVQIGWQSNNREIINTDGSLNLAMAGKDATLTAILSKGEEITERPFILTVPSLVSYPEYVGDTFEGAWMTPGMVEADGSQHLLPEPNQTTGVRINVLDFGAMPNDPDFDSAPSIQEAINSASPGDEVYLPEGTYYLKTASLFTSSYVAHMTLVEGVNFLGDGMDATILMSEFDANTNEKYKTTVLLARAQSNIVMSGFSITSNTEDSMLPDPDVSNLNHFVATAPVYGIAVDNDKPIQSHGNVVIENVLVEKFQRMAMRIRTVNNIHINNCVIQKATDLGGGGAGYGISIQGKTNGADLTASNLDTVHCVVENNVINGPYIRHGILVQYYAHNNLITNNIVRDTLLDAIDLHGEDEYSNEISYNTVINTRRGAGIGLGNSGATHDATGPNNYIHHNTITGGDRGIDVLYGTENTIIAENIISGSDNADGTAIFIQNGNGTKVVNNKLANYTGQASQGVVVLYSYKALAPEEGIPDGIVIEGNELTRFAHGVYVEAHTDKYVYEDNKLVDMMISDYVDDQVNFIVPPISDVVIPRVGNLLLPTDDNFITNEGPDFVQSQANMKFKSSYFDVPYNRMIYTKFDLSEAYMTKEKVYLRISSKSKDGLATINIFGSTEYTDWSEGTITWNNALYHEPNVAKVLDPSGDLSHVTDFTYTTVGTEFNTYYIDVTDYIKSLNSRYVTLILVNDAVENMYCEIYSKETSMAEQQLGLLFSDD